MYFFFILLWYVVLHLLSFSSLFSSPSCLARAQLEYQGRGCLLSHCFRGRVWLFSFLSVVLFSSTVLILFVLLMFVTLFFVLLLVFSFSLNCGVSTVKGGASLQDYDFFCVFFFNSPVSSSVSSSSSSCLSPTWAIN